MDTGPACSRIGSPYLSMQMNQPDRPPDEDREMRLAKFPAAASSEDLVSSVLANGYAIVDKLASPEEMDSLQAEMGPYVDATPFVHSDDAGRYTKRTGALIARSPTARKLITNPLVLETCRALLPQGAGCQISVTEVISIFPGAKAQFIHQDESGGGAYPFPPEYRLQMSTLWAMTDYTEEMGATRLVPGSHLSINDMKYDESDSIAAEMDRGSLLIYSRIYHGGGANRSDRVRQALNVNYNVAWARQEENQYLSTPPEIARTLPHDLLQLMGYTAHLGNLGRVADWVDPLSHLLGEPRYLGDFPFGLWERR